MVGVSRKGAKKISPLERADEDSCIVPRLGMTGSVRLRESVFADERVREDVLAFKELDMSSEKLL